MKHLALALGLAALPLALAGHVAADDRGRAPPAALQRRAAENLALTRQMGTTVQAGAHELAQAAPRVADAKTAAFVAERLRYRRQHLKEARRTRTKLENMRHHLHAQGRLTPELRQRLEGHLAYVEARVQRHSHRLAVRKTWLDRHKRQQRAYRKWEAGQKKAAPPEPAPGPPRPSLMKMHSSLTRRALGASAPEEAPAPVLRRRSVPRPAFGKGRVSPELVRSASRLELSERGRNFQKALDIARADGARVREKEARLRANGPLSPEAEKGLREEYAANKARRVDYQHQLGREQKKLGVNQRQMSDVRRWQDEKKRATAEQKAWEKKNRPMTHLGRKLGLKKSVSQEQGWALHKKPKGEVGEES